METSKNGISLIKQFEGCKLTAYKPVKTEKYYTIGYGHYGADVKAGMTITKKQAEELLKKDLVKYEARVNTYNDKYNWNQNEFDALVSFAYNIGSIRQLTANGTRSREVIANKMLSYNKSNGHVLAGLARRRAAEQALFLTPCMSNVVNYDAIARDVIAGYYGNGMTRYLLLSAKGYDYRKVQNTVNKLLQA